MLEIYKNQSDQESNSSELKVNIDCKLGLEEITKKLVLYFKNYSQYIYWKFDEKNYSWINSICFGTFYSKFKIMLISGTNNNFIVNISGFDGNNKLFYSFYKDINGLLKKSEKDKKINNLKMFIEENITSEDFVCPLLESDIVFIIKTLYFSLEKSNSKLIHSYAIYNLTTLEASYIEELVIAGGIELLKKIILEGCEDAKRIGLNALSNLSDYDFSYDRIIESGILSQLFPIIKNESEDIAGTIFSRRFAGKILLNLTKFDSITIKIIKTIGFKMIDEWVKNGEIIKDKILRDYFILTNSQISQVFI